MNQIKLTNAEAFDLLTVALQTTKLPSEQGPRTANAGEFMLMQLFPSQARFKHADTRNYLVVTIPEGQIVIPSTGKAFNLGDFTPLPAPRGNCGPADPVEFDRALAWIDQNLAIKIAAPSHPVRVHTPNGTVSLAYGLRQTAANRGLWAKFAPGSSWAAVHSGAQFSDPRLEDPHPARRPLTVTPGTVTTPCINPLTTAAMDQTKLPTIESVITDPATSKWLAAALTVAQRRDDLDALKDAQTLAALLEAEYETNNDPKGGTQ